MNMPKVVGIVTGAIPVVGLAIGGVVGGVNFKNNVDLLDIEIQRQKEQTASIMEMMPDEYDDRGIKNKIESLNIPDEYDDSYLSDRVQDLDVTIAEIRTILDNMNLDVEGYDDSDLRGRIAEIEGSISAMSNIDMTSSGDVDIGPLVMRLASVEGAVDNIKSTLNNLKSDVRNAQGSSSRYDDSGLRRLIEGVSSDLSNLERRMGSMSSGGTVTSYDDSSLRRSIQQLQNDVQTLQRAGGSTYDDSSVKASISALQSDMRALENNLTSASQGSSDPRVDTLLQDVYQIKEDIGYRIADLEDMVHHAMNNSTSGGNTDATMNQMQEELYWTLEQFYFEIEDIRMQLWDLQETVNFLASNPTTSSGTSGASGNTGGFGTGMEPHMLYLEHSESSYTGEYFLDGYFNGFPMWVNWNCGTPGSKFEFCYIFRHPVAFTASGWVWVVQPIPPTTEWMANAYVDSEWPWQGNWDGAVHNVTPIE